MIAVPRITDVIKNSKKSSMEDSAKLIATQAEKQWLINQTLSPSDPGYVNLNSSDACSKVSKYNSSDYQSCSLTVNDKGEITSFNMIGKGKFAGLKCTGTSSSNITCTESDTNLPEYVYAFGDIKTISSYSVGTGCMNDAKGWLSETEATKYCNKEEATLTVSIQQDIDDGYADELTENNIITNVQYVTDYTLGEEDYTKVKDEFNNAAQAFIRYGTQDNSKSVCALNEDDLICFEPTSSAYSSNASALQSLYTNCYTGTSEGVDYTGCSQGCGDAVVRADGYAELKGCKIENDNAYCRTPEC